MQLRPVLVLFSLAMTAAGLAACQSVATSVPPTNAVPSVVSTTVPIPAATATSVALPSFGGTQLTLRLPAITGAPAGSTVGVSISGVAPSALPSSAPTGTGYITLSLPQGAVAHGVPTISGAPSGTSVTAYGNLSFPSLGTAPAGHARRQADITFSVLFDPNALSATDETVTLTDNAYYIYGNQGLFTFTPQDTLSLADGSSTTLEAQIVSPHGGAIDPSKWQVLAGASLVGYVHASTKACASGSSTCFDAAISFTNPGPYSTGNGTVNIYFYQGQYLASRTIFALAPQTPSPTPVPTASPTPVATTIPNFQFYPNFNEIVTPDVPIASSFGFTSANISLPDVASPPPAGPLTVTTSLGPLDSIVAQQIANLSETPVATVTFNYGSAVTFSAVTNLTADFCFPSGSLTKATAYVFYNSGGGLPIHAVQTTVAANDATCPNSVHVAALSDFGTQPIITGTNWGYVITTP